MIGDDRNPLSGKSIVKKETKTPRKKKYAKDVNSQFTKINLKMVLIKTESLEVMIHKEQKAHQVAFKYHCPLKRPLEKCLSPGLGYVKYKMSLGHFY